MFAGSYPNMIHLQCGVTFDFMTRTFFSKLGISKWPFRDRISRCRSVSTRETQRPVLGKKTVHRLSSCESRNAISRSNSEDDEVDCSLDNEPSLPCSNSAGEEEWYSVLPRCRKTQLSPQSSLAALDRAPVRLTRAILERHFDMPLTSAAKALVRRLRVPWSMLKLTREPPARGSH